MTVKPRSIIAGWLERKSLTNCFVLDIGIVVSKPGGRKTLSGCDWEHNALPINAYHAAKVGDGKMRLLYDLGFIFS